MHPFIKNSLKRIYYRVRPPALLVDALKLGYIFHTEEVDDDAIFGRLLEFTRAYREETGVRAICTVMTAANERIQRRLQEKKFPEDRYIERVKRLSETATLGYHGHFWNRPEAEILEFHEIRAKNPENFELPVVRSQFDSEINWFKKNGIDHQNIYSAGWWFMNSEMQDLLIEKGFQFDFSFSYSPYFRNPSSFQLMRENKISPGQPFKVFYKSSELNCIQNFIGCHQTPFPQDFIRNMNRLLSSNNEGRCSGSAIGVVNSHDYDLDLKNTLNCIRSLKKNPKIQFFDFEDFRSLINSTKPLIIDRKDLS